MGEKRFTLDDEENGLCRCILVDGEEMPTCDICNLLNELEAKCHKLEKENEQLKQEIIVYKKAFQQQVQRCIL